MSSFDYSSYPSFPLPCACCPDSQISPPAGYEPETVVDRPQNEAMDDVFVDKKHLNIELPKEIKYLDRDFGYDDVFIKDQLPSNFGTTTVFPLLSEGGMQIVVDKAIAQIDKYAFSTTRIPRVLRGGTYRSRLLNSFAHSPTILRLVSDLAGCELIYHPMKIQQLHMNFASNNRGLNIDKWHCDTTGFVLIVFITEPELYTGGQLQYFTGTREEGLGLFATSQKRLQEQERQSSTTAEPMPMLPVDRVHNVGRQSKGHAVFMQGSRIFHQVSPLLTGNERTTLVFSFQPRDVFKREACIRANMTYNGVDSLHVFLPDWVRFRCWRVYERLSQQEQRWAKDAATVTQDEDSQAAVRETKSRCITLLQTLQYSDDREYLKAALLTVIMPLQILCEKKYGLLLPSPPDQPVVLPVVINDRDPPVRVFTEHDNTTQWNLCGALEDVKNCIEDIFDLQQNKETMEYF